MAYQITLTPEEYATLSAIAETQGKTIDALVHEALVERFDLDANGATAAEASPERRLVEYMYRLGHVANLPRRTPLTPQQRAERERLARSVKPGKMASDIVIEHRGPR